MYSISEVSRRLHVHNQTLRNWERQGLLKPQRFGMVRVFTDLDLNRCELIKKYSRRGVSLRRIKDLLIARQTAVSETFGNGGGA